MKETKDEYVKRMLSLINETKINETWVEFFKKFKAEYKEDPDFWTDYMELDNADLTDLEILSSADDNFKQYVVLSPRNRKDEVFNKIDRKLHGLIPDHMQFEIEGGTGVGKSTFMLALCRDLFTDFSIEDVHYFITHLLEDVKNNPEGSKFTIKVLDEDVKTRGVGSRRTDDDLDQLIESCRKAGLSFCRCRAVAKHENQTVFYRFFVFAKNVERRLTCAAVYRHNMCIGFLILQIPHTRKFFEMEYDYNVKKDKFIDSVMMQDTKQVINIEDYAKELLEDPMLKGSAKVDKKNLKLVAYKKFNNLTGEERDLIITQAYYDFHDGYYDNKEEMTNKTEE